MLNDFPGKKFPCGFWVSNFDHADLSLAVEAGSIKQAEDSLKFKLPLLLGAEF